jgi:hypothetical protein
LAQWICDNAQLPLDGLIFTADCIDLVGILGRNYERPPRFAPEVGRYAVFVHRLHDPEYRYLLFFRPTQMITYSIHLYEISENDVVRFVAANQ